MGRENHGDVLLIKDITCVHIKIINLFNAHLRFRNNKIINEKTLDNK